MTLSAEVRRVVTYVNEEGKAVALFDGDNPHKRVRPQRGTVSRLLWVTNETPARINEPVDRAAVEAGHVRRDERCVCVLTGNGLKDPDRAIDPDFRIFESTADADAVADLLGWRP